MADTPPSEPKPSGLSAFWAELRRRHVVRVAITYAVVAWLIIQIAASTFEGFGIPDWAFRFVVIMVILGFPIAVLLAWAFELTPEGIKTTKTAKVQHPDSHEDESHVKKRHWFSLGMAAAVPTLIFGVLAGFFYIQNRSLVSNTEATASDPVFEVEENEKSIAVLPLTNMSPDPENAFFADGVHEDVINNLSRIEELFVIGRTSTLQFRDTTETLWQIGQRLGVRYLVEGSVRRAGNQVRVTIQLIDSETEGQLWSENFNRKLEDIFAIQAEVATQIAHQLHAIISPKEKDKIEYRPTRNQEAYDAFVQTRQLIDSGEFGIADTKVDLLEKAVSLDPGFAEAWALLSVECIWWWNVGGNRNDPELLHRAHVAYENAVKLGPQLPDTLYARAVIEASEHRNHKMSIHYALEALAIDPNFRFAQTTLGLRYFDLGRLAEAQQQFEAIFRNDPLSVRANKLLCHIYFYRSKWDEARALIEFNLEQTSEQSDWRQRLVELDYFQSGDRQAYAAGLAKLDDFDDDYFLKVWRALVLRDYSSAMTNLDQLSSVEDFIPFGWYLPIEPKTLQAALVYFEQGNEGRKRVEVEKAKTHFEGIVEVNPLADPKYFSNLTICYALEGNRAKMESSIVKVRELTQSTFQKWLFQVRSEMHIAIAYLVLGDHQKTIETLEAASKLKGPVLQNRALDLWFIFDRLRGDPRFEALLKG